MIDTAWLATDATRLAMIGLSGVIIYAALLLFTRMAGLRSFSKMSAFDFAITVALGSMIASTLLSKTPSLGSGLFGVGLLYVIQYGVARARRRWQGFESLVDNEPLLLMAGERVLDAHLASARVTEDDLRSKLRLAGVTHPNQVLAVVMETTGDVSVLLRGQAVDPWLFSRVRGREALIEA